MIWQKRDGRGRKCRKAQRQRGELCGKERAGVFGWNMKHQLEDRGRRRRTAPDGVQESEFLFNAKDNWQSLWEIRKEKRWHKNTVTLKSSHLMEYHVVFFFLTLLKHFWLHRKHFVVWWEIKRMNASFVYDTILITLHSLNVYREMSEGKHT